MEMAESLRDAGRIGADAYTVRRLPHGCL